MKTMKEVPNPEKMIVTWKLKTDLILNCDINKFTFFDFRKF